MTPQYVGDDNECDNCKKYGYVPNGKHPTTYPPTSCARWYRSDCYFAVTMTLIAGARWYGPDCDFAVSMTLIACVASYYSF